MALIRGAPAELLDPAYFTAIVKCPLDVPHANSERLLRLVVELDGGQHHDPAGLARDRLRTAHLERQGLELLRFSNLDV